MDTPHKPFSSGLEAQDSTQQSDPIHISEVELAQLFSQCQINKSNSLAHLTKLCEETKSYQEHAQLLKVKLQEELRQEITSSQGNDKNASIDIIQVQIDKISRYIQSYLLAYESRYRLLSQTITMQYDQISKFHLTSHIDDCLKAISILSNLCQLAPLLSFPVIWNQFNDNSFKSFATEQDDFQQQLQRAQNITSPQCHPFRQTTRTQSTTPKKNSSTNHIQQYCEDYYAKELLPLQVPSQELPTKSKRKVVKFGVALAAILLLYNNLNNTTHPSLPTSNNNIYASDSVYISHQPITNPSTPTPQTPSISLSNQHFTTPTLPSNQTFDFRSSLSPVVRCKDTKFGSLFNVNNAFLSPSLAVLSPPLYDLLQSNIVPSPQIVQVIDQFLTPSILEDPIPVEKISEYDFNQFGDDDSQDFKEFFSPPALDLTMDHDSNYQQLLNTTPTKISLQDTNSSGILHTPPPSSTPLAPQSTSKKNRISINQFHHSLDEFHSFHLPIDDTDYEHQQNQQHHIEQHVCQPLQNINDDFTNTTLIHNEHHLLYTPLPEHLYYDNEELFVSELTDSSNISQDITINSKPLAIDEQNQNNDNNHHSNNIYGTIDVNQLAVGSLVAASCMAISSRKNNKGDEYKQISIEEPIERAEVVNQGSNSNHDKHNLRRSTRIANRKPKEEPQSIPQTRQSKSTVTKAIQPSKLASQLTKIAVKQATCTTTSTTTAFQGAITRSRSKNSVQLYNGQ